MSNGSGETVLVTGGYGCIGAETVKWLAQNTQSRVVVASRTVNAVRTDRVFHEIDRTRVTCVQVDVCDQDSLEALLLRENVTRVVHLAALQTPDCNRFRDLGLQVNLAGTQKLIEAIKSSGRPLERFVFASSAAVYGPRAMYPDGKILPSADLQPVNVYGIWKMAGEQLSSFFEADSGVPTICLRPGVLYGPGRDAGLTASPTTAMKSVALGLPYEIPFCSRQDYLFAPDVGAAFGNAAMAPYTGYGVYNLPNLTIDSFEFLGALKRVAAEFGLSSLESEPGRISVGADEVPFICDLDFNSFVSAFPEAPHTGLEDAIRRSLQVFRDQVAKGWLIPANL